MASSGKKGKKNKGTVISLQSFLSNGDAPSGTTQVAKKIRNVDGDESDDGNNSLPLVYQLPTAPRANRIFDDDSIPHKPPFIAYLTNLPFDVTEEDIHLFFGAIPLISLRLPREEGETSRVRGFGYVEFDTRDDLINVLSLPDPSIKGRRIRIEISNEQDQQNNRQRANRRGFDNFGNSGDNRDSTNWRRDNQNQETVNFGNNYERNFNRERKTTSEEASVPGSWRTGRREPINDLSPKRDRGSDRQWDNIRSRHGDREDRHRMSGATINHEDDFPQERPKLNLKPRTLPLPEIVTKPEIDTDCIEEEELTKSLKSTGIGPEKVFGSAKPVDTAARELEIEERLAEIRRQEKFKKEQLDVNEKLSEIHLEKTNKEKTNSAISWRRRNDPIVIGKSDRKFSPERKGVSRQDDRRRESIEVDRYSKSRDKNDRLDFGRGSKTHQNREGKQSEDCKIKREIKSDRSMLKYQTKQAEPVLQTSNKYSGLDDEASE